jgi:hypothetical protein
MTQSARSTQKRRIDPSLFLYLLLTLAMTWPLLPGIARDVPGDLGDSLLNLWILGWGAENIPRVLSGRMTLADFWNANIFHPEPLALSFSEHLFGQVIQILPITLFTDNLILAYNLLFVTSFALSGWGMYLLVRDLIGEPSRFSAAAFVAGVTYAFVPLRIAQVAHIQSLSSQWMPFALLGFHRFVVGSPHPWRWLAAGSAALLMQNWSCGYYLIFFSPFVVIFVLHQIWASRRGRDLRVWAGFGAAAIVVAAGTWPFLSLYLEAQRVHAFERPRAEVIRFSADLLSYLTAPEALQLWGARMQAMPKPEGELFLGLTPLVLLLIAIARRANDPELEPIDWRSPAVLVLLTAVVAQGALLAAVIATGGFVAAVGPVPLRATNPLRLMAGAAIAYALLCAVSPSVRRRSAAVSRSTLALAVVLCGLAIWLSLGPLPMSNGRALQGLGLYDLLYRHVPGFDGLRVPARYAMIASLFLSIAAGYGAASLLRRTHRRVLAAGAIVALFLAEAAFAPMLINQTWGEGGVTPPPRVEPAASAPDVYKHLAQLDAARVVAEFPFGDPAWELRYVYYSTVHWKRLVNGYSGGFPPAYMTRVARLQRIPDDSDAAWHALVAAGVTHVIVHEAAYANSDAAPVADWLVAHGARAIGRFGTDVLFTRE